MSDLLKWLEARGRRVRVLPAEPQVSSGSPAVVRITLASRSVKSIDIAKALIHRRSSVRAAKDVIDRLVATWEAVADVPMLEDFEALRREIEEAGARAELVSWERAVAAE
jgi:hypothetical protein